MLANPKLPLDLRKIYEGPTSLMSDYARFDVKVDQVLAGKTPTRISVTWDNSTFGEREKMNVGPFLIALRRSDAAPSRPKRYHPAQQRPQVFDDIASAVLQALPI